MDRHTGAHLANLASLGAAAAVNIKMSREQQFFLCEIKAARARRAEIINPSVIGCAPAAARATRKMTTRQSLYI
jgi:hypothetical protein